MKKICCISFCFMWMSLFVYFLPSNLFTTWNVLDIVCKKAQQLSWSLGPCQNWVAVFAQAYVWGGNQRVCYPSPCPYTLHSSSTALAAKYNELLFHYSMVNPKRQVLKSDVGFYLGLFSNEVMALVKLSNFSQCQFPYLLWGLKWNNLWKSVLGTW